MRPGRRAAGALTLVRRSIAEPVVTSRTIHAHGASYQYLRLFGFPASAAQSVRRLAQRAGSVTLTA